MENYEEISASITQRHLAELSYKSNLKIAVAIS